MAGVTNYVSEQVLLDVTVTSLAAGATIESPKSGSKTIGGSTIQITPNTIDSTSLPKTYVADALHVYVIPPVAADGTFPDFEFWFKADDESLQQYQIFDGSADGNMAPWVANIAGGYGQDNRARGFALGKSARAVMYDAVSGKPTPNMPLVITGIKYQSSLTVVVRSQTGWTSSALTPARIIVTGELLDEETVAMIASGYNGFVAKNNLQRQIQGKAALTFVHQVDRINLDTWTQLPGGVKQKGERIHRFARWGTNASATGTQAPFPLTNQTSLKGSDTNVGGSANAADSDHDLGFDTVKTGDALWVQGFGCRPGANQAYVGWEVDGQIVPNPKGHPVSQRVNRFAYGSVQPQRPESNLYLLIPRYPGELLIAGEGAVPFIAANGTAIAAGDARVAVDGVYIKRSA